jgi:hypothetical protein
MKIMFDPKILAQNVPVKSTPIKGASSKEQITLKKNPYIPFVDFCATMQVKSGGERLVPFILYDYQKQFIEDIQNKSSVQVVKGRQMGLTELIAAYFLWNAYINPAYKAVVISKTGDDAGKVSKRIKFMALTSSLNIKFDNDGIKHQSITGGGDLYFEALTENTARGIESVTHILMDECSFWTNPSLNEVKASALPGMSMVDNPCVFYVSTPNGTSNEYYQQLVSDNNGVDIIGLIEGVRSGELPPYHGLTIPSEYGDRDRLKVIIHWRAHPKYGNIENFLEKKSRELSQPIDMIQQEYDLSFLVDNVTYFNQQHVLRNADPKAIRFDKVTDKNMLFFHRTFSGFLSTYCMFIDPAGSGSDNYCAIVVDVRPNTWQIVDWYYMKGSLCETQDHFKALTQLGEKYQVAGIYFESNAMGQYLEELFKQIAPKLRNRLFVGKATTSTTKVKNLEKLKFNLEQQRFLIPPECPFFEETKNFIRKGAKLQAADGYRDDFVMCLSFTSEWMDDLPQTIKDKFDGGSPTGKKRKGYSQANLRWQAKVGANSHGSIY